MMPLQIILFSSNLSKTLEIGSHCDQATLLARTFFTKSRNNIVPYAIYYEFGENLRKIAFNQKMRIQSFGTLGAS